MRDVSAHSLGAALAFVARQTIAPSPAAMSLPGLDGPGGLALAALGPLLATCDGPLDPALPQPIHDWSTAFKANISEETMTHVRAALGHPLPEVVFAETYERLIGARARRSLGTYFTPQEVVRFMITIAGQIAFPRSVVDAGAGVGALSLAAAREWPEATVHAIDINAAALGLLAFAARPSGNSLVLHCRDYLSWITDSWSALPEPRLLVANPPFTRHQARNSEAKDLATVAAGALVPYRTASLSTYVLAATLSRLGPRDGLCLLLPDNWLQASYGRPLRQSLWCASRPVDLYAFTEDHGIFPEARLRAVVLAVGPESVKPALRLHAVRPGPGDVKSRTLTARTLRRLEGDLDDPLADLWRRLIIGAPASSRPWRDASGHINPALSDLIVLRRGIATGSNPTFLLTDKVAGELGGACLRTAVHRLSHVEGDRLDEAAHEKLRLNGRRCWLLDLDGSVPRNEHLDKWLQSAVDAGIPDHVLCRRRKTWTSLEFFDPAQILLSPATLDRFRIVENIHRAYTTNNVLGLHDKPGSPLSPSGWAVLAKWLRSDDAQEQWRAVAKVHSGGLMKIEPRAARSIRVPAVVSREMQGI